MATDAARLHRIESDQQLRGFSGMLAVELKTWFPWRVLTLVAAGAGVFASIYLPWRLADAKQLGPLLLFGMGLWAFVMLIATIAISEGTVLGDIHRGTASWLVGLPVGRPAVIAAKFAASAIGLTTAIVATGLLMYPVLSSASKLGISDFAVNRLLDVTAAPIGQWGQWIEMPTAGTYLGLLAAMSLVAVFLVAVLVLLGTVLRSRTVVFGVGLGAFGALVVGWAAARDALVASPVGLVTGVSDGLQDRAMDLALPAAATALLSVALIGVAIWRFHRKELA